MIRSISSADGVNFRTYSNLDEPTILNASKLVLITVSFLQLGLLGGIFLLFFLVTTVTSCLFFYIYPRSLLVTIYFLVGLYALLVDVGVSFSTHLCGLKSSFEVLEVHSIKERSIGAPAASSMASDLTTVSPSATTALSKAFNC